MAEVQLSGNSAEMTKRFIEFVMMQAQQISLFLGILKHPQAEEAEPNLELAKIFIDQLEMIREKTRGNLTKEEEQIINNIIAELQISYVEISKSAGQPSEPQKPAPAAAVTENPSSSEPPKNDGDDDDHKKRFTKSYG